MNSPRKSGDDDADSDATYCSEIENEQGEGRLNDIQASTSIIIRPGGLGDENQSREERLSNGERLEDNFEDQETQENIIPDSAQAFNSRAPLFKNVPHSKKVVAITQADEKSDGMISNFEINMIANENIIPHSRDAQNLNAQSLLLKNITHPSKTGIISTVNTHEDETEGIVTFFQSTLSFAKDTHGMESDKNSPPRECLTTSNDYQEKSCKQYNQCFSHSEPMQLLHKREENLGEKTFHSEPSEFNTLSAKKFKKHALPQKRQLEHHRLKMTTHCQTLTSRLYAIRNEVSLHIRGCGPKLEKMRANTLFEEVKVLRKIMSQLYDASTRLVTHIGGKPPLRSTEYLAADQACERLLVQLNPETFREDFTPLQDMYDSEQDGDQMNTEEVFFSQDYEEGNSGIMEVDEYSTPPRRHKVSKNVHFQSPLAKLSTHTYLSTARNIKRQRIVTKNEGQPTRPKSPVLKTADSNGIETVNGELETSVLCETPEIHRHSTQIFHPILEEGSRINNNETETDYYGGGEEPQIQRIDEAGTLISDNSIRRIQQNRNITAYKDPQTSIHDADVTMSMRSSVSIAMVREYSSSARQGASPEMIFTDTASSTITRLIQPQLDYSKNNPSGYMSPKTLINPQEKIQSSGDRSASKGDNTLTVKNTQHYPFNEENDSDITYISQQSIQPLNHKSITSEQTSKHVILPMRSQVVLDRGTRGRLEFPESMQSHIRDQTYNLPMINHGTTPQNSKWSNQKIEHEAQQMDGLTKINTSQERELFSKHQTDNTYTNQQDLSLTCWELSNSQNTTKMETITNNPIQQQVSNEFHGQQIITQGLEDFDNDIPDITFDCFTSDDDTQLPSSQLSINGANISLSECTYMNDENQSQSQRLVPNSTNNDYLKELSRGKGASSDSANFNSSQENRDSEVIINDSQNGSQPPGWCNIFEQHKEKKTLPTLTELMIAGMISPGEMVLSLKGSRTKATLLKNAKIMTSEGATFHSPMAWCSAWHEGKTVSRTLAYQRVYYNGVTLMDICQKAFNIAVEEIASAIQEKRRRENSAIDPVVNNEKTRDSLNECLIAPINNSNEAVIETKKESLDDIIINIHSVYVHNEDEYLDANFLGDFLDTGIPPTMDFQVIDQW